MSESPKKSSLPDFDEVKDFVGKLCNDLKKSVTEIYQEYQDKRAEKRAEKSEKGPAESKEPEKSSEDEAGSEKDDQ